MIAGLVSVTFRKLPPIEIVRLVGRAGLDAIEWGGDVHAPHGDLARAAEVRAMTGDAGLSVSSYGSYYYLGCGGDFGPVLDSAAALGAPVVRVWAGRKGSAEADEAYRHGIAEEARRIAERAAGAGVAVALEFHERTLTDCNDSAERLLREAGHPNLYSYWQLPQDSSPDYRLRGLRSIGCRLTHLHVNAWTPAEGGRRTALREMEGEWPVYLAFAASLPGERAALIEFVRDDSPDAFLEDAGTLKGWLERIGRPAGRKSRP